MSSFYVDFKYNRVKLDYSDMKVFSALLIRFRSQKRTLVLKLFVPVFAKWYYSCWDWKNDCFLK